MMQPDIEITDERISTDDGLSLHCRTYEPAGRAAAALPVVCLPGLSRNGRDFQQLAMALAGHESMPRRVITVDSRGRGLSDRDPDPSHYSVPVEMMDVVAACARLGIARAAFIGTSRGGLILHGLATVRPDLIAGVVLNDIGPVIELSGLLAIRDLLAGRSIPDNWAAAAASLQAAYGQQFPALVAADWQEMAEAIYREIDGQIVADFDPAIAASLTAIGTETVLPDLWAGFEALTAFPMLAIRGEHSDILAEATLAAMQQRHPAMQVVIAKGQGHAPLLHLRPLPETIQSFLASVA